MEYKDKKYTYLGGLVHGISTLATGMKTSIKVYFRKKVTEQYPENRKELKMFDRFRGTLNMPHNENNEHRCVACGLCQMACPNDTIKVTSETVETEDGKKKKILATYEYDLGACMFCQLCVNACPHDAITFDQNFEHAVFDRTKLVLKLNHDGSKVIEKKKELFGSIYYCYVHHDGDYPTYRTLGHLPALRALRHGRHLFFAGLHLSGFRSDYGLCRWYRRSLCILHPADQWRRRPGRESKTK